MKLNPTLYKYVKLKAYFDKGYAYTTYPKWVLATIGIGSSIKGYSLYYLLIGGFLYGISCFIIGWICYKYSIVLAEQEVGNQFNLFVQEMRRKLKHRKI